MCKCTIQSEAHRPKNIGDPNEDVNPKRGQGKPKDAKSLAKATPLFPPSETKESQRGTKGDQRPSKGDPKAAKGCHRGAKPSKGDPKNTKGHPKGATGGADLPKGKPKRAKGHPERAKGEATPATEAQEPQKEPIRDH